MAIASIVMLIGMGGRTLAQEDGKRQSFSLPNLKMPTLGGVQFWTDLHWRAGWRIQHNAVTGHYRLLDPNNTRHAWGNLAACEEALDGLHPSREFPNRHLVILLHGLGRSSNSMRSLGKVIQDSTQFEVAYFEYASTRASISDHAEALRRVVAGLPPNKRLSFVGHSMGNIVVRHAIGDWKRENDSAALDQIDCIVMLGPPNQGASIARQLSKTGVFGWITGDGGMELGPRWDEFEKKLATPNCPFGIIAGRLPTYSPSNPLVDGEGDFVVSIEEAKLDGATEMLEVPRMHSFLMDDPAVQTATLNFLDHHYFSPVQPVNAGNSASNRP